MSLVIVSKSNGKIQTGEEVVRDRSFSTQRKIFRKAIISYTPIRTRTCVYQGVRNVRFLESFVYTLLNDP